MKKQIKNDGQNDKFRDLENKDVNSEHIFLKAFKYSGIGFSLIGKDGIFIEVNQKFCKILDFKESEIKTKTIFDIIPSNEIDKNLKEYNKLIRGDNNSYELDSQFSTKTGACWWGRINVSAVRGKSGDFLFGIMCLQNITEEKKHLLELESHKNVLEKTISERTIQLDKALEELKKTELQLIQSEKMASLGVLTAGVAHEINNPLNYIQSGIYGLKKLINSNCDKETFNTKIFEIIQILQAGVKKAANIVKSLGTFSKTSNGEMKRTCDIHKIIENCLLILNYEIVDKCTIIKRFNAENPIIEGNEEDLHQVFIHLIMNSVQAIGELGEIEISTGINTKTNSVEIIISDTGEGISDENLSKVFDPFFTTKSPGKGSGLGLSIVYYIINQHKGRIEYKSDITKGAEVLISLPMKA